MLRVRKVGLILEEGPIYMCQARQTREYSWIVETEVLISGMLVYVSGSCIHGSIAMGSVCHYTV